MLSVVYRGGWTKHRRTRQGQLLGAGLPLFDDFPLFPLVPPKTTNNRIHTRLKAPKPTPPPLQVLALDNLALPFRDESLDAVLSIAVVHHLATTERRVCALRELARVLRIGGRLIISVWAMEQANRKFESQDVLVPWHRPRHQQQRPSTPSLELASTATTSEDDGATPYQAYTQSESDSGRSTRWVGCVYTMKLLVLVHVPPYFCFST